MVIYYIKEKEDEKWKYLKAVLADYAAVNYGETDFSPEVKRIDTGRPFVGNRERLEFSITHTEGAWLCAVSEDRMGIDCERDDRDMERYEGIAKRFFCCEEGMLVSDRGQRTFLRIWTRKEAYLKYTGEGLGRGLSSFSVVKNGAVADEITGSECIFRELSIDEGLLVTLCCTSEALKNGIILKTASGEFMGTHTDWKIRLLEV